MTVFVVEHDPDGYIVDARHETDDDYQPADGEEILEGESWRSIYGKMLDLSTDPPELTDIPGHDPRTDFEKHVDGTPVRRADLSDPTRDELKDAIEAVDDPDAKAALATIYEVLTGNGLST